MLLLTLLLLTSVLADSKGDSNMILTSIGISDDIAMHGYSWLHVS